MVKRVRRDAGILVISEGGASDARVQKKIVYIFNAIVNLGLFFILKHSKVSPFKS